jgi:hypothetical protein
VRKKWTKEIIIELILPECVKLKRMPNREELEKLKSGLSHIISKFGGSKKIANELGYKIYKPNSWEKEDLLNELKPLCEIKGRMLSSIELDELGKGIYHGVVVHGGVVSIAKELNFKLKDDLQHLENYWTEEQIINTVNEFFPNRMPIVEERSKIRGLNGAIVEYGGIKKLSEKTGIGTSRSYITIDNTFTKSSLEAKFSNFMYINGIEYLHDKVVFNSKNYRYDFYTKDIFGNDLFFEIWGMTGYRNYDRKRRKKEILYVLENKNMISIELEDMIGSNEKTYTFLKNLMIKNNIKIDNFSENIQDITKYKYYGRIDVMADLKKYCTDHNLEYLPTRAAMLGTELNYYINYFGTHKISLHDVAKELGLKVRSRKYNYWNSEENIKKELQILINLLGRFPSSEEMEHALRKTLLKKGIVWWANEMGYKAASEITADNISYYRDFNNIEKVLLPIIEDNDGLFPSKDYLLDNDKEKLYCAIRWYHGGIKKCAKKFGLTGTAFDKWCGERGKQRIINEIMPICQELGKFPTSEKLKTLGKYYLIAAMRLHEGSAKEFAILLGYKPNK